MKFEITGKTLLKIAKGGAILTGSGIFWSIVAIIAIGPTSYMK